MGREEGEKVVHGDEAALLRRRCSALAQGLLTQAQERQMLQILESRVRDKKSVRMNKSGSCDLH